MLTGDNDRTAKAVAREIGIDGYRAEVLPADKAGFVRAEHKAGRKAVMIGDGINDSQALSEADVGIAVNSGAAIAREIADVEIGEDNLHTLVTLRRLCSALQKRNRRDYAAILGFNSLLIALGMAGVLPPTLTALLHNTSTIAIAIAMHNMTDLLPEDGRR